MALPRIYKLKQEYLEHLDKTGCAQSTIENYDRYLQRFIEQFDIESPEDISAEVVEKFKKWLNRNPKDTREKKLKKRTQNYYLGALRQFLAHLSKKDIESISPKHIELTSLESRTIELISIEELETFLKAPRDVLEKTSDERKKCVALRDIAILETLFSTGLRVSELTSLSRGMDFPPGSISFNGRGGKERSIYISKEASQAIRKYLDTRSDSSDALFISHSYNIREDDSARLTSRSIQRIVKRYATIAGISPDRITPQTLRHLFATNLIKDGKELKEVQELLGHSNISTTQIYSD